MYINYTTHIYNIHHETFTAIFAINYFPNKLHLYSKTKIPTSLLPLSDK